MSLRARLKRSLIDGVLLIVPFVVVVFVLNLLVKWASLIINPLVKETRLVQYTSNIEIVAQIIAGIFVIALIILLGFIYTSKWSLKLRMKLGKVINFIPLVGTIYLSVRQVASSIGETESRFKKLVMLEYPRDNIHTLGLVTGSAPKALTREGSRSFSVFIPNSPNPTGGRTIIVPEEEIIEVDMSVQKGLKLMLTTGIAFGDEELPEELKDGEKDE